MKIFSPILMSVFVLITLFLSGCDDNSTEPDTDIHPPEISVTYPTTNSVIGDTITFKTNAVDNNSVTKVEFFIDNILVTEINESPYEYLYNSTNMDLGSVHSFFAKAYDNAENTAISDTIQFYYQWITLLQDEDEPFPRDLDKVYIRSTSTLLEFRIETNGNWSDPHAEENGIDCALFFDTDQNPNTGLNPQDSTWYSVGDIGPDFVSVVGWEGDSLWVWADSSWTHYEDFNYLNLQNNVNYFEVGINLDDLGNPDIIDIVAANLTIEQDSTSWDWAPNEGHITYEMYGLYIGNSRTNYKSSKNFVNKPNGYKLKKRWLKNE